MSVSKPQSSSERQVEFSPGQDPFESSREKGTWRWIISHLFYKRNKYIIFIVFFTTIFSSILSSASRVVIGDAVSEFLGNNFSNFIFYIFLTLLLGLGAPLVRLVNFMLREIIAQRMERDTREEFFINLLGKSQSFHDRQEIGDLMARATDDVRNLNFLVSPALSLILESFTSLVIPTLFVFLFYPNQLAITPIVFSIIFLILIRDYNIRISPVSRDLRRNYGKMNSTLNETLSGIEVVKASAEEDSEVMKYFFNAKAYKDSYVERGEIQAKYLPILLLAVTITFSLGHSIFLYLQGIIDIGQIIGYIGLISLLRFPTNISVFVFAFTKVATSSAERLLETMSESTDIGINKEGISKNIEGEIRFENVTFAYPNHKANNEEIKEDSSDYTYVLKDISFKIGKGKTVAIVGTAGSGKTTLTKLISRLYDVNKGRILIDGIDVRDYELQSLRNQISYIEQDLFLFTDTIFENISFGRTSSMEEVQEVAKEAQAHDFIKDLPEGYETEVGERGVTLSGGEKQRIAIARAFLTDPKILVLDDATSAIDSETEDQIQKAIKSILKNRTTFLITHRLSQIRWADLIIVLKNGRIEAKGSHKELIQTSGEYQKIFVDRFEIDKKTLMEEM
ncbi:MAG: putative multidrug export ATP-binding/permease protein [Promethearchaeota archaeon]|nr:MAG: putative multidrug export ATP-binding/permease protein [Candidatus Lokiarchaeota archaeon]